MTIESWTCYLKDSAHSLGVISMCISSLCFQTSVTPTNTDEVKTGKQIVL